MEPFRISGIEINNVGVFEHLDLEFNSEKPKDKAEIHIFTGDNGTGKSTLLQALAYFSYDFGKSHQGHETSEENLPFPKHSNEIDLLKSKGRRKSKGPKEVDPIIMHYGPTKKLSFPLTEGTKQRGEDFFRSYFQDIYNGDFKGKNVYFFAYSGNRFLNNSGKAEASKGEDGYNPLLDAVNFNKTDLNNELLKWLSNIKIKSLLAADNKDLKLSETLKNVLKSVESGLSRILGREVTFSVNLNDAYVVKLKLDGEEVDFNQLADGHKSVITWFVDLIHRIEKIEFPIAGTNTKRSFILFLDEIEVHMHPAAQRRILPVIQETFPNAQIFLTTHSPFVIGSVKDAWVYKFRLDKGKSVLDEVCKSDDGRSYRYAVEQILGIETEFSVKVEKQLKEFYVLRSVLLAGAGESQKNSFLDLARDLKEQGEELNAIIGSELRQLTRITKEDYSI